LHPQQPTKEPALANITKYIINVTTEIMCIELIMRPDIVYTTDADDVLQPVAMTYHVIRVITINAGQISIIIADAIQPA
jgi:hypothetical protein